MRIMIADGHGLTRDCLRLVCQRLDPAVEVLDAPGFSEMMDVLKAAPDLSLLVVDLDMAAPGPLEGVDAIRRVWPGRLAVLSAFDDHTTIGTLLAKGVAGFIPKRLGLEAVSSALRLMLAGETFVPAVMLSVRKPTDRASLTDRERQVLDLLRDGLSNKGIARQLNLSEVTVKTHLSNAFRKLGVHNRVQAARLER